jgi:hypothetical protein
MGADMKKLLACSLVVLLSACSGGSGRQQTPVVPTMPGPSANITDQERSLVYAYPMLGQTDVVPSAPIVLRFSHPLHPSVSTEQALKSLFAIRAAGSTVSEDFDVVKVPDGKGVVITPKKPLQPKTQYTIVGQTIPLTSGNVALQPPSYPPLTFTTRAAFEGPTDLQSLMPDFQVAQLTPAPTNFLIGNKPLGLIDFSTIRLLMTQPIDSKTVQYGTTIRLLQGTTLVPARVLVQGNRLSIDPEADLNPNLSYTLSLTNALKSTLDKPLVPGQFAAYSFMPLNSGINTDPDLNKASRIEVQVLTSEPTGNTCNVKSLLTDACINQVPVASPLLGQKERAPKPQAEGKLFADLALPANFSQFTGITPLRVPRGNILKAGNLSVKLDGLVPAGIDTGDLTITLISDANGLLLPNRYSTSLAAPAMVTLEMDINVTAQNGTSNGAFTQDISHVQVVGLATLDQQTQVLTIEAVGTIELKILGVDNAVGVLALKLKTDLKRPAGNAVTDIVPPEVQSWVPGETVNGLPGGEFIRPGDPLLVNFNKAMDIKTFQPAGVISLLKNNVSEPFTWRLDGVSLIVTPNTPWEHGKDYRLALAPSVKDFAGNALKGGLLQNFNFKIPGLDPTKIRPPIVLSNYPGFPCPIAAGTRNVAAGIQGKCAGGRLSANGDGPADDDLPLPLIEPNRVIEVNFSQSINPNSVTRALLCNGIGSVRVERVDASGNCLGVVPGTLKVQPRALQFVPAQPWVVGQLYRYVLHSNNDLTSSAANCTGSQAICGINGLPLQTQLIAQTLADARNPQRGGPPLEVFFRGGPEEGGSSIGLRVLPVLDVNANFRLDPTERRSAKFSEPGLCNSGRDDGAPTPGRCLASNGALLQPDRITTGTNPSGFLGNGQSFSGAATKFRLGCESGIGSEDEKLANGQSANKGIECQGNQFLLISAALNARLNGNVEDLRAGNIPKKAIRVQVSPSIVVTSGAYIYADLGLTPDASPLTAALFGALGAIPGLGGPLSALINTGAGLVDGLLPIGAKDATNTELQEGLLYTGPLVFRMRYPEDKGPIEGRIFSITDANGVSKLMLEAKLDLYTDIPEINAQASILGAGLIPIEHKVRSNDDLTSTANLSNGSGSIVAQGEVKFLPDGRLTVQLSNKDPVRLTAKLGALGGLLGGELKVRVPAGRFIIDASLAPLKR